MLSQITMAFLYLYAGEEQCSQDRAWQMSTWGMHFPTQHFIWEIILSTSVMSVGSHDSE